MNPLGDYVEVKDRLAEFYAKHPEGSIDSRYEFVDYAGKPAVVVTAVAYRTPDDQHPSVGLAKELIPGATSFTRGSELENAQTSAWGRALGAMGIGVKGGLASAEEVAAAKARNTAPQTMSRAEAPIKVERVKVSHSDQTIPEFDPWTTTVAPEHRPAVAVSKAILGAETLTGPAGREIRKEGTATDKQIGFSKKLIREAFPEAVDEDSTWGVASSILAELGMTVPAGFDAMPKLSMMKLIDALKAGGAK